MECFTVDYSHFPTNFENEDDALNTYNSLGLELKIQFKKYTRMRDAKGQVIKFSLQCAKNKQQQ